jgi:hypothetical protein
VKGLTRGSHHDSLRGGYTYARDIGSKEGIRSVRSVRMILGDCVEKFSCSLLLKKALGLGCLGVKI